MSRAVPEWKATHDDQAIPPHVKLRIWEREKGICSISGRKIRSGEPYDFEHRIALCNGGEHRESNIFLALRSKHKEKTARDRKLKAKTDKKTKFSASIDGTKRGFYRPPGTKFNWQSGRYERKA